jgi:hypothetical protein
MSDDEMTIDERYKYLCKMQKRYRKANRQEKGELLDEMEAVTELHRKSLIRHMNGEVERKLRRRERGKTYQGDVTHALGVIAESLDWVCAERLQPNLVWMAEQLVRHGELVVTDRLLEQLGTISVSTVRRRLADQPRDRPRLPRQGPEQANRLAREIPAGRIPWDEHEPGHFEVDLVHHSGPSASGQYAHTLQMVDVATAWSERVAVLGRSGLVVEDAFKRILARLPFEVREVHPDNGSEFLNNHLVRFWDERASSIQLTRSRAWQKNDNRFVEQKNDTLVRAYLGHDRLDTVAQTTLLNQLYELMGLYYNLFQPVMRLAEKTLVSDPQGRFVRTQRRFDTAQTPFDRLYATGALDPQRQHDLQALRGSLNPRQLRQQVYALLDQLFALPCAAPEQESQNVYLTLFDPPEFMKGEDGPVTLSNESTILVR